MNVYNNYKYDPGKFIDPLNKLFIKGNTFSTIIRYR